MFKGKHYSKNEILLESNIYSNAHKLIHYDYIHAIYKKVANELGLYFPYKFGFAYSLNKDDIGFKHKYNIEANNNKVTKCDFRYSLQILLEDSFYSPLSLKYALKNPKHIENHAKMYFNCEDDNYSEYISDLFIVKNKINNEQRN